MAGIKLTTLWRRPESRFLILFLVILGVSFTVVALQPADHRR